MSLDSGNWAGLFNHRAMKDLAAYLTTYNMETQAVAFAAADPATTGTKQCVINGVYIPSLTAEDDADWSSILVADLVEGDAKGFVMANLYSQYLAVFANADGRLRIDLAGEYALDAAVELKVPHYDPTEWCCIAIVLVNAGGAVTLGTTNINAIITIYQVLGPVLPHPSNMDLN